MQQESEIFFTNVTLLKRRHGWNQEEIAEKLGIRGTYMSELMNGRKPGVKTLAALLSLVKENTTPTEGGNTVASELILAMLCQQLGFSDKSSFISHLLWKEWDEKATDSMRQKLKSLLEEVPIESVVKSPPLDQQLREEAQRTSAAVWKNVNENPLEDNNPNSQKK